MSLAIVGLGPGGPEHRTAAAEQAIRNADVVIGYGPYVDAMEALLRPDQLVLRGTMGAENERAAAAIALARCGWRVALVSSGDAGVFAMAARTLELAGADVTIEVVPGVTAAHASAAVAGAPLGAAHALVTLSDLPLSWTTIEAQLRAGHPEVHGLCLALVDWSGKLRLPQRLPTVAPHLAHVQTNGAGTACGVGLLDSGSVWESGRKDETKAETPAAGDPQRA